MMKNGEKGQALVIVLALVALGGIIISPFLGHAGSSLTGSRLYGEAIQEQYASDAGVEHAVWELNYGELALQLTDPGDAVTYQLGEAVNGVMPDITVSKGWEVIAADNFESGGWAGGTGWFTDWYHTGASSVTGDGAAYQGSYHLFLTSSTGYARRSVDLKSLPAASLKFWAKLDSFEGGETARCLVSPDGSTWTAVKTWVNGDDDGIYHAYSIDLSSYAPYGEFWIAFEAGMDGTNDYFYIDDLKVVWAFDTSEPVASEDFESGDWTGGTGWAGDWYASGIAAVNDNGPYEGNYGVELKSNTGYIRRTINPSSETEARLQFWTKADSWKSGDEAYCRISENGSDWTTLKTWVEGDDDNNYRFYNFDLASYSLSGNFSIAFQANMSNAADYFYVDDIRITGPVIYGIRSIAGENTTRAVIEIAGSTVRVLWWVMA